ncbi:MAG: LuxR C-terminal-related transcriptional regulator [Acidimicrobiales bacterium]
MRVLIADPQLLFADALALSLAALDPEISPLDERPSTGVDAIDMVIQQRPDVTILDYWMPGSHAPSAIQAINGWVPGHPVLVLSAVTGPDQIRAALDAGAAGFMPKSIPVSLLAEGVRRAAAGERPVFPDRLRRMLTELSRRCLEADIRVEKLLSLTPRELVVLKELSDGSGVQEVADRLSIRAGTVRQHIHGILRKTGAHSLLEAVAIARHEHLITGRSS